jgi:phosphatidylserine/phosphatidylglycerophosphate/cardiolipin synthase-like enzyme
MLDQDVVITPIIGKQFPGIVIEQIKNAKESIKIIVFDWRWYPNEPGSNVSIFNQALISRANSGVAVSAITNSEHIVRMLNTVNIKAKKLITKKLVHIKMMIIDDKHLIIGSHNYTNSAFELNYEISVLISNCPNIEVYTKFFEGIY